MINTLFQSDFHPASCYSKSIANSHSQEKLELLTVFSKNQLLKVFLKYRSSHRTCSVKDRVLRNFAKFIQKHPYQSHFFNKLSNNRPHTSERVSLKINRTNSLTTV